MGTNMYPSSSLLGQDKDSSIASLPVDELIEKADGFAGVFPGRFFCYVLYLQKSVILFWLSLSVFKLKVGNMFKRMKAKLILSFFFWLLFQ